MPTLLDTFDVREIAFAWGGTTRVFYNNELTVLGDEDLETWTTADKKNKYKFDGVWLFFDVMSPFLQRKAPQSAAGNDWIDVKNAILNSGTEVTFYPIYSLDQSVSYVIVPMAENNVQVLSVKRGMAYPEANLKFKIESQLSEYPAWLRITKYKG